MPQIKNTTLLICCGVYHGVLVSSVPPVYTCRARLSDSFFQPRWSFAILRQFPQAPRLKCARPGKFSSVNGMDYFHSRRALACTKCAHRENRRCFHRISGY
ncbi:hypothetical protein KCP75_10225 [Salmonella enterica subsp. enterica]|nr:hypothetical protein KCP75_10225 [Salmonella enterica subsp. enterica]